MQGKQINRDEEVRQLAYRIWQEAGCPHGADVQHWLKAQAIWLESHPPKKRRAVPAKATTTRKPFAAKREF